MHIFPDPLRHLVARIFAAAGCHEDEAKRVARYLVEANLVGHDSHGVIRVSSYIGWLRSGKVKANQVPEIVRNSPVSAVVDGHLGLGQTMAEAALQLGLEMVKQFGLAAVALRNAGHIGRICDWAEMAAHAGFVSLHFVNTSGFGILVAPLGGIERRLSANPVAAGIPISGGPPIIWDISTATIAEGKIRVALNKGEQVAPGSLIDSAGAPTTDPRVFYGPPPGAILPFGAHKGYGMSIVTDILAGALTGSGCSNPAATELVNGMLTILISPAIFGTEEAFTAEVERFLTFVRSSKRAQANGEILLPGMLEARLRAERQQHGIELDETTWQQLTATAQLVGLDPARLLPDQ